MRVTKPGVDDPNTRPKPNSVPLARASSTPSTYDKPERARTSHACEPCRERKTKCDGERPSCRRCQHTGTGCHYGYGKGWRKRKTQEDLSVTSSRLARFEALLNEIHSMVSPEVQARIQQVREEDAAAMDTHDNVEEAQTHTGSPNGQHPQLHSEGSTGSTGHRLPLPYPSPTTAGSTIPMLMHQASSYERGPSSLSPSTSHAPPLAAPKLASEDSSLTRLPSITPDGQLIEPSLLPSRSISDSLERQNSMEKHRVDVTMIDPELTASKVSALPLNTVWEVDGAQ